MCFNSVNDYVVQVVALSKKNKNTNTLGENHSMSEIYQYFVFGIFFYSTENQSMSEIYKFFVLGLFYC